MDLEDELVCMFFLLMSDFWDHSRHSLHPIKLDISYGCSLVTLDQSSKQLRNHYLPKKAKNAKKSHKMTRIFLNIGCKCNLTLLSPF